MKNTINILTPNVINQIAAGEVIQRPASVIKELLENAIDANSKNIEIIIENAGKTLIKIVDDGHGMSEKDAKICFHKHSTSKIKKTEDIMNILTMGFRGEALSSIAAISDVELQTKTKNEQTGTFIHINHSEIKSIKKIALQKGSTISVKNLFFNIPARKNFLKSDQIENKHILDTFMQITIAHPQISFTLKNNGQISYKLPQQNTKQRIIQLFGKNYNKKILPIKEETSIVSINGFLGNPLDSKKTRGEQFLYVNNRFIKSSYLHHAIKKSMQDIITKEQHPSYFIFLQISPKLIDINIHPNKTEIQFEDEKAIYKIMISACKRSIGMHNITPSLDFTTEESFEIPPYYNTHPPKEPKIKINNTFNPFKETKRNKEKTENLDLLFQNKEENIVEKIMHIDLHYAVFTMINNNVRTFNIIDKKRAVERVTYEDLLKRLKNRKIISEIMLNPCKLEFNPSDINLLKENNSLFKDLGYEISAFNKNNIIIRSTPSNIEDENLQELFELFLEHLKNKNTNIHIDIIHNTALKMTYNISKQKNTFSNNQDGLVLLIKKLFDCQHPFIGINGSPCVINIEPNDFFK